MTANDHAETDRLLVLLQETSTQSLGTNKHIPHSDIKDAVSIALHGSESSLHPQPEPELQTQPKHVEFDIARKVRFDEARLEQFLESARSQQQHDRSERVRESEAYDWAINSSGTTSHRKSQNKLVFDSMKSSSRLKLPLPKLMPNTLLSQHSTPNEQQFLLWSSTGIKPTTGLAFSSLTRKDPFSILKSLSPVELTLFEHQFPSLQAQQWRLVATTVDSSNKRVLVLTRNKPPKQNYTRLLVLAATAGIVTGTSFMGLEWWRARKEVGPATQNVSNQTDDS